MTGQVSESGAHVWRVAYALSPAPVLADHEPHSLLTTSRRDAWLNATNPTSTVNLKRITSNQEGCEGARGVLCGIEQGSGVCDGG